MVRNDSSASQKPYLQEIRIREPTERWCWVPSWSEACYQGNFFVKKEKKERFACTGGTYSLFAEMGYKRYLSIPQRACQVVNVLADREGYKSSEEGDSTELGEEEGWQARDEAHRP